MNIAIFSWDGLWVLFRWSHYLFGIAWIGMLYYFNFVQGGYMAAADPAAKTDVTKKLVPKALWYFRWGAMFTFIIGDLMLLLKLHQTKSLSTLTDPWGVTILTGATLGTIMWANVWFVIWPRQKKIIAAANGEKIDNLPAIARRAFLASRTNVLLSVPMLFFMGAASHLQGLTITSNVWMFACAAGAIMLLLELNALLATTGPTTKPIEKPIGVIHSGLVLTVVLYALLELLG